MKNLKKTILYLLNNTGINMNFINGDISQTSVDCLIIPNNGRGIAKKGVTKSVLYKAGEDIVKETLQICFDKGFYKAGDAFETHSGDLSLHDVHALIHAVTSDNPKDKAKIDICRKAIISSIILLKARGFKTVAIPSIGIEARNIDAQQSSKMMIETLLPFDKSIKINIIDTNENFMSLCTTFYEKLK